MTNDSMASIGVDTPSKHLFLLGVVLLVLLGNATVGLGKPIARESELGDALELLDNEKGGSVLSVFRVHQFVDLRYFAAGVGKAEIQATYPPFPLKLVFTESGGAYLALVSVSIHNVDGDGEWRIPASHVTGPWLFLDLKPGRYDVEVRRGANVKTRDKVLVTANRQNTVHFMWP